MDFKINKQNRPVLKEAAACCATNSPTGVVPVALWITLLTVEEEGGLLKGSSKEVVSIHAGEERLIATHYSSLLLGLMQNASFVSVCSIKTIPADCQADSDIAVPPALADRAVGSHNSLVPYVDLHVGA